ncbi:ribbon-helix-helix domain-containing protein [Nocardia bovistercoris]|uniref:Toxin-antitoxin system antitoxin subunit n=1 Tax=Nocardia bovistercoris TaxID=2785916 RepID=A0A931ICG5_9NOCA|nr:hypothetical protein [Nocardia bovistercoris]MBH0777617.1 hypothetical protein [Nocardia bovistercoris]
MKRITISVPDEVAAKADNAVAQGEATSVSAWFSEIARREPDWFAAEQAADELATEAGVTDADLAWARATLGLDSIDEVA